MGLMFRGREVTDEDKLHLLKHGEDVIKSVESLRRNIFHLFPNNSEVKDLLLRADEYSMEAVRLMNLVLGKVIT